MVLQYFKSGPLRGLLICFSCIFLFMLLSSHWTYTMYHIISDRSQVTCNLRDTGEAASLAATPGTERTTLSWSHAGYLFHSAVTDSTKVMVTRWGLLLNNSWLITREHPSQLCGPSTCEMTTQHLRAPSAQWSRLSPLIPCNFGLRDLQLLRGVFTYH